MLYRGKYERARQWEKEQLPQEEPLPEDLPEGEPLPEKPKPIESLEKRDTLAMILSAMMVILPVALLALLVVAGLACLFFGVF